MSSSQSRSFLRVWSLLEMIALLLTATGVIGDATNIIYLASGVYIGLFAFGLHFGVFSTLVVGASVISLSIAAVLTGVPIVASIAVSGALMTVCNVPQNIFLLLANDSLLQKLLRKLVT